MVKNKAWCTVSDQNSLTITPPWSWREFVQLNGTREKMKVNNPHHPFLPRKEECIRRSWLAKMQLGSSAYYTEKWGRLNWTAMGSDINSFLLFECVFHHQSSQCVALGLWRTRKPPLTSHFSQALYFPACSHLSMYPFSLSWNFSPLPATAVSFLLLTNDNLPRGGGFCLLFWFWY